MSRGFGTGYSFFQLPFIWVGYLQKLFSMIDYKLIAESTDYYESKGFKRIESPWTVSEQISALTLPSDKIAYKMIHNKKVLVGSGEQSFLYLYNKGFLPKGRFQTVTPCFRDEEFSTTHTKYFLKNELIITDDINEETFAWLIDTCQDFFKKIFNDRVTKMPTEDGYDLLYRNVEIGSYGVRQFPFLKYIYGTGLAEPRTSMCKNI
jgi:hypothetical protein